MFCLDCLLCFNTTVPERVLLPFKYTKAVFLLLNLLLMVLWQTCQLVRPINHSGSPCALFSAA